MLIIERFGRLPHRNEVLERLSTADAGSPYCNAAFAAVRRVTGPEHRRRNAAMH